MNIEDVREEMKAAGCLNVIENENGLEIRAKLPIEEGSEAHQAVINALNKSGDGHTCRRFDEAGGDSWLVVEIPAVAEAEIAVQEPAEEPEEDLVY